jgi:nucleoside-diphosphate-sugar epimerase
MHCLVTGAAGFIGSHLCERLLAEGHSVVGVDGFIPYYPRPIKEQNLVLARQHPQFTFHELDLRTQPIDPVLDRVEAIFHLAAMAGLVKSWTDFDLYASCNLTATARLLEAIERQATRPRFIYGSTSSVYGRYSAGDETLPTRPISPYGVTKLASENLCFAHADRGLPLVVLRFFSVYGPRQRPDMGYFKFIDWMLKDQPVIITGDGHQVRGNTYVDDCVAATMATLKAPVGETYNLGGGETASVWDILHKLEKILGKKAQACIEPARPGDQRSTFADTGKLVRHLGWRAQTGLEEGLRKQVEWQRTAHGV